MSSEQLTNKIISQSVGISSSSMRRGDLTPEEFLLVARATNELNNLPVYIDDTAGITVASLKAKARRMKRKHGLDLIIIDYIQLISGSSRRSSENRVQEVSEITRSLKGLAKDLNVPVLALSQLSRQVENRENKRPRLSDLRESGSIEQDADMVMFIYRDEYYKDQQQPEEGTDEHDVWQTSMGDLAGKADLIISKQRHGPTGTIQLHFEKETTTFTDVVADEYLPERFE